MKALCKKTKVLGALSRFHQDEQGAESIENICALLIAALVLYGVYEIWESKQLGDSNQGGLFATITSVLGKIVDVVVNGCGLGV
jgi:hypothetical protein